MFILVNQEENLIKKLGGKNTMPTTLSKGQQHLLKNPKLLKEMTPQKRGAFFRNVRKKAIHELNEIVFLAKTLPERQQAQVFSEEKLSPLFDALFSIKRELDEKDLEKRRGRLLQIFRLLFSTYICNVSYVIGLAKKEREIILAAQGFATDTQALYIASTRGK